MASTVTSVAGWLRTTFGPPIELLPSETSIAKFAPFIPQDVRPGEKYVRPVKVQHEQGVTYNSDHSAFTILDPLDGLTKRAELEGAEILLSANISYGVAAKMGKQNSESSRAYKQAVGETIEDLMISGEIRRELALLYGPGATGLANLGVVEAVAVAASGGVVTVSITRASYAPGMWPQLIGANFDFHSSAGTLRTATTAATLTAVNPSNTRLTFTGTQADLANIVASDVLTFRTSRTVSCTGLQAIYENTGSLFNIDAAVYPQWRCNTLAVNGPFTFDKLQEGLATPHENGQESGMNVFLGARAWTDLMTDEAALRRHPEWKGKEKAGYSKIEFDSLCGRVNLITHRYMKQSLAMGLPDDCVERVGAQDLSFSVNGSKNEWFWRELETKAGFSIRLYGDQSIIITKPNHAIMWNNITSSADVVPA